MAPILIGGVALAAIGAAREIHVGLGIVMLATTAYAALGPVMCLFARAWWASAIVTTVMFTAMFMGLGDAAQRWSGRQFGENGMVLLLPFMLFPAAMFLSGAVRGVIWWVARRRREPERPPVVRRSA